jgi:hypothetical protein
MTTREVVSGILLSRDELLRMEQLTVHAGANLIDHGGLQIKENSTRNMLPCAGLREKRVEGIITTSSSLITGHLSIRLQTGRLKKRNKNLM